MNTPIRILLADDHPLMLIMVKTLLDNDPNMVIVGEARDGHETQSLCRALQPNIILLDLDMAGPTPQEIITYLRRFTPDTKVLILTGYDGNHYFPQMLDHIAGYILKTEPPNKIREAICTIMQGGTWYSQAMIQTFFSQQRQHSNVLDAFNLTDREVEILQLSSQGGTNREIGTQLHISERTVRYHLRKIYDKLGVHSRAEAIAWAVKAELEQPVSLWAL